MVVETATGVPSARTQVQSRVCGAPPRSTSLTRASNAESAPCRRVHRVSWSGSMNSEILRPITSAVSRPRICWAPLLNRVIRPWSSSPTSAVAIADSSRCRIMPEVVRSPVTSTPVITAKRGIPLESRTRSLFHTTRSRSPFAVRMSASRWPGIPDPSAPSNISRTVSTRSGRVKPSHRGRPTISSSRKPVSRKVAGFARTTVPSSELTMMIVCVVSRVMLVSSRSWVSRSSSWERWEIARDSGQRHQGGADEVGLHERAGHRRVDGLAADADGERSAPAGGEERGEDAQRQQLAGDHRGAEPQPRPDQQRQRQEGQRQLLLGPEDGQREGGEQE